MTHQKFFYFSVWGKSYSILDMGWRQYLSYIFLQRSKLFNAGSSKKISMLFLGSTDFGNVTFVVPGLHPYFYIGSDALNHTEQYTEAAGEWK